MKTLWRQSRRARPRPKAAAKLRTRHFGEFWNVLIRFVLKVFLTSTAMHIHNSGPVLSYLNGIWLRDGGCKLTAYLCELKDASAGWYRCLRSQKRSHKLRAPKPKQKAELPKRSKRDLCCSLPRVSASLSLCPGIERSRQAKRRRKPRPESERMS